VVWRGYHISACRDMASLLLHAHTMSLSAPFFFFFPPPPPPAAFWACIPNWLATRCDYLPGALPLLVGLTARRSFMHTHDTALNKDDEGTLVHLNGNESWDARSTGQGHGPGIGWQHGAFEIHVGSITSTTTHSIPNMAIASSPCSEQELNSHALLSVPSVIQVQDSIQAVITV
jgi:hypothetical protein